MTAHSDAPILVTGATGHLGRLVLAELRARGATNVTAGTRDPAKAAGLDAPAVRVDFDDAGSLDAAFAGVERLLIVSTDAIGQPGKRLTQHLAAIEAASRAGVRHVVYTSMPAPEPGSLIPFAPDHYGTEQALRASGLGHTILRNNWYFENLVLSLPAALASGTLYAATGTGRLAHGSRADYARAAAGALLTETGSATYDVTGPEAHTTEEIAAAASAALGRPIATVQVDDAAFAAGLRAAGVPEGFVGLLAGTDANIRSGRMATVGDAVERLSGRKPQRLADWLAQNAALFAAPVAAH